LQTSIFKQWVCIGHQPVNRRNVRYRISDEQQVPGELDRIYITTRTFRELFNNVHSSHSTLQKKNTMSGVPRLTSTTYNVPYSNSNSIVHTVFHIRGTIEENTLNF
jgi:hypothetical protein